MNGSAQESLRVVFLLTFSQVFRIEKLFSLVSSQTNYIKYLSPSHIQLCNCGNVDKGLGFTVVDVVTVTTAFSNDLEIIQRHTA